MPGTYLGILTVQLQSVSQSVPLSRNRRACVRVCVCASASGSEAKRIGSESPRIRYTYVVVLVLVPSAAPYRPPVASLEVCMYCSIPTGLGFEDFSRRPPPPVSFAFWGSGHMYIHTSAERPPFGLGFYGGWGWMDGRAGGAGGREVGIGRTRTKD
jgi:hypothetical protein